LEVEGLEVPPWSTALSKSPNSVNPEREPTREANYKGSPFPCQQVRWAYAQSPNPPDAFSVTLASVRADWRANRGRCATTHARAAAYGRTGPSITFAKCTFGKEGHEMDPDDVESVDKKELQEILDRKPSPFPNLLTRTAKPGQNARIEPSLVSASGMIADYFEFARNHPMPETSHEQDLDRRIVPLLFVYRHATELALKYAFAQLRYHIRQREPEFDCQIPDHHSLGNLLGQVRELFARAKGYLDEMGTVEFLSNQAQDFIRELDRVDPKGEAFRYAHGKRDQSGAVRPQIHQAIDVSIDALRAGMLHVEKELLWLIDIVEITSGLYDQWTADLLADAGW
jgi:hypothetical protein